MLKHKDKVNIEVSKDQLKEMKGKKCLSERIHTLYEKYEEEFEKHGIDRLEIKEKYSF